jgi:hypothetical protein
MNWGSEARSGGGGWREARLAARSIASTKLRGKKRGVNEEVVVTHHLFPLLSFDLRALGDDDRNTHQRSLDGYCRL